MDMQEHVTYRAALVAFLVGGLAGAVVAVVLASSDARRREPWPGAEAVTELR
jgi:hypothetical protein